MDVATQFFLAKNITLDKILFSALDGINRVLRRKIYRRGQTFSGLLTYTYIVAIID